MTAPKPRKVGELVDVAEGAAVTRPDGKVNTVTGGFYVLDTTGTFDVAGSEVTVE